MTQIDRYINRIKNRAKRQYAFRYMQWIKCGKQGQSPERPEGLGLMGAQAVMLNIEGFIEQNKVDFVTPLNKSLTL